MPTTIPTGWSALKYKVIYNILSDSKLSILWQHILIDVYILVQTCVTNYINIQILLLAFVNTVCTPSKQDLYIYGIYMLLPFSVHLLSNPVYEHVRFIVNTYIHICQPQQRLYRFCKNISSIKLFYQKTKCHRMYY